MTTTTAQAVNVLAHLEYYLQVVWPELAVNVLSTTEQWAGAALAGPNSRNLLGKIFPEIDVSNEGIPFMGYKEANLFGVPARIFRISFSGELAYEINVESGYGVFMWEKNNGTWKRIEYRALWNGSTFNFKNRNGARSRIRNRWKSYFL